MKEFYTDEEMKKVAILVVDLIKEKMEISGRSPPSLIEMRIEMSKRMDNPNTCFDVHLDFQTQSTVNKTKLLKGE